MQALSLPLCLCHTRPSPGTRSIADRAARGPSPAPHEGQGLRGHRDQVAWAVRGQAWAAGVREAGQPPAPVCPQEGDTGGVLQHQQPGAGGRAGHTPGNRPCYRSDQPCHRVQQLCPVPQVETVRPRAPHRVQTCRGGHRAEQRAALCRVPAGTAARCRLPLPLMRTCWRRRRAWRQGSCS